MNKIKIVAFDAPASGSGISIAKGETKGQPYIRVGLTGAAQVAHFGGELTDNDALSFEVDATAGKAHMIKIALAEPEAADAVRFKRAVKGSVYVKLVPWVQVAEGKRPPVQMVVVSKPGSHAAYCKLPEWARPDAKRALGKVQ